MLLRRLCCVALSCCGLLLLGGATAWAAPAWLAPADVSTSGLADDPIVAADSQGDMTAVWLDSDGVHASVLAAVRPAGGAWPPPVELSSIDRNADDPAVAVDPQGDATAVWVREDATGGTLQAAMRPAGGTWQSPVDVSSAPDLEDPEVAVDSQGDATAVWDIDNGTNTVQAAVRPAGGAWQAPVDLSPTATDAVDPRVAFDQYGNATAVWELREGTSFVVQAATRPTGGPWQAPVELTTPGQDAEDPHLAVDPAGDAIAAWDWSDGTHFIVRADVRPAATGRWQSPVDLSAAANSSYVSQVAIDPQGDAIAVWVTGSTYAIVQAAVRPAGQTWQTPTDLSADNESADDPHVAFDAHGNAVAVWTRSNGMSDIAQAASRPAGGAWQTPVDLSATGADALHPQVAVDPQGNATAVWSRNFTIQAAGYDAAGPLLRGLSIPASGTAGKPVSFSVAPLDVWSATAVTAWSFGDGQTGTGETLTHTYAKPGSYTVGVSSSDALANATGTTAQITIAPAPAIATPPATGPTPTPTLTGVSEAHRRWREGDGNAVLAATSKHKLPLGTSFAFTLNETARVTFVFSQTTFGHRVAGKCQAADQHNRKHVRCRRTLTRGTLTDTAGAGRRKLAFQGQINGRRLPVGAYMLTLTATTDSGQRSRPHALRFTVGR